MSVRFFRKAKRWKRLKMIEYENEPKGYEELQEECERLRSENQMLSKELAYYRSRYGKFSEEGGEEAVGYAVFSDVR